MPVSVALAGGDTELAVAMTFPSTYNFSDESTYSTATWYHLPALSAPLMIATPYEPLWPACSRHPGAYIAASGEPVAGIDNMLLPVLQLVIFIQAAFI